jgi:hypothetical protein
MVKWPFPSKKVGIPFYTLLVEVPSRHLPDDLAVQEKSDDFSAWRDRIESELCDEETDENTPAFATFLRSGEGFLQLPVPEKDRLCLLAFTTPLRAADYVRVQVPKLKLHYAASSPRQVVNVVRDCRQQAGTTDLALDRCPRCSTFVTVDTSTLDTATKVIKLWKISAATTIARTQLYRNYARSAARNGDLIRARDVALELVGHVTTQDALTHLLLGKLAIRLSDELLVKEAHSFLTLLRQDALCEELRNAKKNSEWQF